jgi:hypothetical protein
MPSPGAARRPHMPVANDEGLDQHFGLEHYRCPSSAFKCVFCSVPPRHPACVLWLPKRPISSLFCVGVQRLCQPRDTLALFIRPDHRIAEKDSCAARKVGYRKLDGMRPAKRGASADVGPSCHLNSRRKSERWYPGAAKRPPRQRGSSRSIPPPCRGCWRRLRPNSGENSTPFNYESDTPL